MSASSYPNLALPKPRPKELEKIKQRAKRRLSRSQCVAAVWRRELRRCEWCGRRVYRPADAQSVLQVGHVDEIIPRSKGGSPRDPENCRLLCPKCHAERHDLRIA